MTETRVKAELEWCFHPFRRDYATSTGVVVFLIALCAVVFAAFNDILLTVLTALIMLLSLWQFFLPSRYYLTDEGITVKTFSSEKERCWSDFRSVHVGRAGILLRSRTPGVLKYLRRDDLRMFFPDGGEERTDQVIEFVKEKVEQARDEQEGGPDRDDG